MIPSVSYYMHDGGFVKQKPLSSFLSHAHRMALFFAVFTAPSTWRERCCNRINYVFILFPRLSQEGVGIPPWGIVDSGLIFISNDNRFKEVTA